MARIRSIKPEFWHDRKLARSCSRDARMLYAGLWNHADEHGRANGDPAVIKGQVFPYDDDLNVPALLAELVTARRVLPYEVDGDPFLFLPKLAAHQRLDTAKVASKFPEPPADIEEQATAQVTAFPESSEKIVAQSENGDGSSVLLYGTGSRGHGAGDASRPPLRVEQPADTIQRRAEPLTRWYYDRLNGMCKWPAVLAIVKQALKSGYDDQVIADALARLADEGRPLTVDVLRIEMDGLPARASPRGSSNMSDHAAVVRQLEQGESA